jgi:hypothetical protein
MSAAGVIITVTSAAQPRDPGAGSLTLRDCRKRQRRTAPTKIRLVVAGLPLLFSSKLLPISRSKVTVHS